MVVMSERMEKRPGATPAVFPPTIFVGSTSISMFHVSPPPPRGNTSGGLYIVILGQAEDPGTTMDDIRGPRHKRAWVARPGWGPRHDAVRC
jgi:hypothetical protein